MKSVKAKSLLCLLSLLLSACPNGNMQSSIEVTDWTADDIPFQAIGYPITDETTTLQLLYRRAYTVGYNTETLLPEWVIWQLTEEMATTGISAPSHNYHEDNEVPRPRATESDYLGIYDQYGLSHGHMCPLADCKWNRKAATETNLLTNICPQEAGLNSGMWNQVEQACRRWAVKYGCVYIVCGPLLYKQEHMTIGEHHVVVPEAFFKVILRLGDMPACIGYVMKNGDRGRKRNYINTLSQVELLTGLHFFPNLPDSIRLEIENIADEGMW